MSENTGLLRASLRGNAIFSTSCALGALLFAAPLTTALGVPSSNDLVSLGIQLLLFAAFLVWLASRPVIKPGLVWAVIAADVLWVLGTIPVVMAGPLTFEGNVTALVVADIVALWAFLQWLGLRRARSEQLAAA